MNKTWRRINLAQAYLRLNRRWASAEDLVAAGAAPDAVLIYRAARRMEKYAAIEIADAQRGRNLTRYRLTGLGLILLGFVPARMEDDDDGQPGEAAPRNVSEPTEGGGLRGAVEGGKKVG